MNEYIGELFSALAYPSFAGVVATEGDRRKVESLPPSFHFGDFVRGRMSEAGRHPVYDGAGVEGLFEPMLSESFG